jgi:hypothetical protein
MKKTNILYWIFTGLFGAFMLMSGIQNLMATAEWKAIMEHLGFPVSLLPFLGIAKCLGVLALVVPGFPRLKEWAYAGFFFDLLGVTYSAIATDGIQLPHSFMAVLIALLFLSYGFYHKKLAISGKQPTKHASAATM